MSYLPSTEQGLLPYWQLLIGTIAVFNTIRTHRDPFSVSLIFDGSRAPSERTSLATRNYGAWTLTSGLVRIVSAYRITDPAIYALSFATYFIVTCSFIAEWRVYGTMRPEKRMISGLLAACISLTWMLMGWACGWYA